MPVRTPRTRRGRVWPFVVGVIVVLLIILVPTVLFGVVKPVFTHHRTFTVTRLDDQSTKDGHKYLVFTKNGVGHKEVFEDTDSFMFLKTDSSDLFNDLEEGHTYRCKTFGFRFSLSSSYENLINCKEVPASHDITDNQKR